MLTAHEKELTMAQLEDALSVIDDPEATIDDCGSAIYVIEAAMKATFKSGSKRLSHQLGDQRDQLIAKQNALTAELRAYIKELADAQ